MKKTEAAIQDIPVGVAVFFIMQRRKAKPVFLRATACLSVAVDKKINRMKKIFLLNALLLSALLHAQEKKNTISNVWVADNGNGTYKNPVVNADYSDPDAIRVGDDFYMISSSFNHIPGLPILHSKDLVNWQLIGHALKQLTPKEHFSTVRHGGGVWAPSIRYHNNEFYIYFPDPDFGIYVTKAKTISGPWTEPILVEGGKGLIDPCPLWDEDGKAYLTHAYAGSRAGFKSIIVVKEMDAKGEKIIGDAVLVYDGQKDDPHRLLFYCDGWQTEQ